MKALKDFIYDKNDLIIALLVLVLAALIIAWRMDVIMNYPEVLAQETGTVQVDNSEKGDDKEEGDADKDSAGETTSSGVWSGDKLAKDVTVEINPGSATAAAQCLVDAGLFKSYEDYENACASAGTDPTDIHAATFTFEKGLTKADIAKEVTQ